MEITNRIVYILRKHVGSGLDEQETTELRAWAASHPAYAQLLAEATNQATLMSALSALDAVYGGDEVASVARMERRIAEGIALERPRLKIRRIRQWLPYAAAIVLVAMMGGWIFFGGQFSNHKPATIDLHSEDIAPGTNRATLKLADGRIIDLNEEQSGIVVGDGITYLDGSQVIDHARPKEENNAPSVQYSAFNSITTPKGGTYQIILPDGSKVWLNAASTLQYPSRFSGKERVVELIGEAYFEVESMKILGDMQSEVPTSVGRSHPEKKDQRLSAKSAFQPFKVITSGQTIEVLGTQFSINAYPDEPETKTTLVEGVVRVEANGVGLQLVPGEQGRSTDEEVTKMKVDIDQYTAWKDGRFHFRRTPLEEIMRQVSRWYDVEVVYQRGIPKETFSGKVSRNVSLMGLLDILQVSAIKIRLEGNRLIIN